MSLRYSSVVLGNADQAKTLADKVHFLLLLHASAVHRYIYTVLYHLDHRSFSVPGCLWSVSVAYIRSLLALPSFIFTSSSRNAALWCTGYHKRRTWPSSLISRQLVLWQSQIARSQTRCRCSYRLRWPCCVLDLWAALSCNSRRCASAARSLEWRSGSIFVSGSSYTAVLGVIAGLGSSSASSI